MPNSKNERTIRPARFIVVGAAKSQALFYSSISRAFKNYGSLDQRLVHVWLPSLTVTTYTPLGKSDAPRNGATA